MKIKLTKEIIDQVIADPEKMRGANIHITDPWWIIALKTLAYLIGLLLAGMGTVNAATSLTGII